MGILNIGAQALQANLVALQTAGNNIANVNTPGYSRQRVIMQAVPGQFTGGGYVGKGVSVQTIERNYDAFLNRQSTLAIAIQSGDTTRSDYLKQLEDIFPSGTNGLGASINDMLNAFSDVASAPGDLTARTVALTRVDETAGRLRSASQALDDLQNGISQALKEKINAVNTLAGNIADINGQIAKEAGTGQPPNDLLDKREELIRELNKYVQTSQIPADDGTVGVFIGGSQALVLGSSVATVSLAADQYGDPLKNKLAITRVNDTVTMDENTLGGGEVSGLLRFQNTDLIEGRNLLGRLTTGITTAMNDQHKLGLDLDGKVGTNILTPASFGSGNILPAVGQTSGATIGLGVTDVSKFAASDYELAFTTATSGTIKRLSDGKVFNFPQTPAPTNPAAIANLDGLDITMSGSAAAGDHFLLKPFATSANNVAREFSTPRALAVSSPIAASMSPTNRGSISLNSLTAQTQATTSASPIGNYTIKFAVSATTGAATYDILDSTNTSVLSAGPQPYLSGQAISYTPAAAPGFTITLSGTPTNNDSVIVGQNPYPASNGGNATAMMDLRDKAMFDGAAMTDGYAGMISQIGIRAQSANYSAQVSTNIATSAEAARTGVQGVNLDEEAARLLQYQQAYQASAKMVQIAQSIFQTLIQGLT